MQRYDRQFSIVMENAVVRLGVWTRQSFASLACNLILTYCKSHALYGVDIVISHSNIAVPKNQSNRLGHSPGSSCLPPRGLWKHGTVAFRALYSTCLVLLFLPMCSSIVILMMIIIIVLIIVLVNIIIIIILVIMIMLFFL